VKIKNLDGAVLITWLGDKTCYLDPEKGEYCFISSKNAARKVKSLARSGNTPAARNLLQVLERTEKISSWRDGPPFFQVETTAVHQTSPVS